jgi:hypothetical protein
MCQQHPQFLTAYPRLNADTASLLHCFGESAETVAVISPTPMRANETILRRRLDLQLQRVHLAIHELAILEA